MPLLEHEAWDEESQDPHGGLNICPRPLSPNIIPKDHPAKTMHHFTFTPWPKNTLESNLQAPDFEFRSPPTNDITAGLARRLFPASLPSKHNKRPNGAMVARYFPVHHCW